MARRAASAAEDVPELAPPALPELHSSSAAAAAAPPARPATKPKFREVAITAPMLDGPPNGYITLHLERQLDRRQSMALARLQYALNLRGARTLNGQFVGSASSAIGWLLEQLPDLAAAASP